MAEKLSYQWWPTKRVCIQLKIADELWFDTKTTGDKIVHLFRLGWYEKAGMTVRLYSLTLLNISIQVGF